MPRSYAYNIGLSWPDYLKVNEIRGVSDDVRQLRYEVSAANRKLIATYEELQREHIAATKSISDAVSSGFEQLSFDMQRISSGITELTSVFEWGFSELLTGVGHLNDSLTELVRISKTPAQTWAYEQFEIARDAFRQGLYEEALEYLNRSIEGYGGNTGYKLEYRFHFLLGTIRMGSFQNNSPSIVDLGQAEKAFLASAKYAKHDQSNEAGRALLAAGWTAYCQGKIYDAEKFTEQAISLYPELGEAHFQMAKLLMHRGDPENALRPLGKAVQLDRNYTIKASSDDDFRPYDKHVNSLIQQLHKEAQEKSKNALVVLDKEMGQLEKSHVQEFSSSKYADLNPLKNSIKNAKMAAGNNTYFGYLDALSYLEQAKATLSQTKQRFMNSAIGDVRRKISGIESKMSSIKNSGMRVTCGWLIAIGVVISFFLSISQCSSMMDANKRQRQIRKNAVEQVLSEMRSKGYDPDRLSVDQARRLGYDINAFPPDNVGSAFGTWLGYLFIGVVISVLLGNIANSAQKRSEVSDLEIELSRLKKIEGEFDIL